MTLPFPVGSVVLCYRDRALFPDGPDPAETAYWTRLVVPEGLPVFADDRPWCEAILAHFNPVSERCWIIALATEDLVEPFLERFPAGIATGGPSDMDWAVEVKPSAVFGARTLRGIGCKVLNSLPEVPNPPPASTGEASTPPDDGSSSGDESGASPTTPESPSSEASSTGATPDSEGADGGGDFEVEEQGISHVEGPQVGGL